MRFAYRQNRSVEDALLLFLNNITKHLDASKTYTRVLFIDFSSAFNTIQPHLLVQKLISLNVNPRTISWILDFLTHRPQYVNIDGTCSDTMITNTGAPQGCVLSPVLYSIYTNDYRATGENTRLIKFADDTTLQGLLSNSEECYRSEVKRFCDWCKDNYLTLNVDKTKELIFYYRIKKEPIMPLCIGDKTVTIVDTYKYLGLTIDSKLNWHAYVDRLCKIINQQLYFLRKLNSFNVNKTIMNLFYNATIESIICFGITCWGGSALGKDKAKIDSLIKRAGKIIKTDLPTVGDLNTKPLVKRSQIIIKDIFHPLNKEFTFSIQSGRVIQIKARTDRYKNSLVPSATSQLRLQLL